MKRHWLWLSSTRCHDTVWHEGNLQPGADVYCQGHRKIETAREVWRVGWWVKCMVSGCVWHPMYVSEYAASRRAHGHMHEAVYYFGTRTMRLSEIIETQKGLF